MTRRCDASRGKHVGRCRRVVVAWYSYWLKTVRQKVGHEVRRYVCERHVLSRSARGGRAVYKASGSFRRIAAAPLDSPPHAERPNG